MPCAVWTSCWALAMSVAYGYGVGCKVTASGGLELAARADGGQARAGVGGRRVGRQLAGLAGDVQPVAQLVQADLAVRQQRADHRVGGQAEPEVGDRQVDPAGRLRRRGLAGGMTGWRD